MIYEKIETADIYQFNAHEWVGQILDHFGRAEQAIGELCLELGLPITSGSLGSLKQLRTKLAASPSKRARTLERRIGRWQSNRPYRHLLAHARIEVLFNNKGEPVLATRHLPRDPEDVTRDKLWTADEQKELLKNCSNDGRSICDLVNNILTDKLVLTALKES